MSGGIMGFDDCEYSPTAWQQQYCMYVCVWLRGFLPAVRESLLLPTGRSSVSQHSSAAKAAISAPSLKLGGRQTVPTVFLKLLE
jgi:hypothetical protein